MAIAHPTKARRPSLEESIGGAAIASELGAIRSRRARTGASLVPLRRHDKSGLDLVGRGPLRVELGPSAQRAPAIVLVGGRAFVAYPYRDAEPAPRGVAFMHVADNREAFGREHAADMALLGDIGETLAAAAKRLGELVDKNGVQPRSPPAAAGSAPDWRR